MTKKFIVVSGNIGSGKTTLTERLAKKFGWKPYYESVSDNPYLADFYGDMKRWSLPLQIYFLSNRFETHQMILDSSHSAIQDRSIYEDIHIFARALQESGQMDQRDFQNYRQVYHQMVQFLTPPDLVVYVRCSIDCLKSRIRQRGRDYETDIPTAYLEHLNRCYEDWIETYRLGKVLTVNADALEIKDREDDLEYLAQKIEHTLEQPELFSVC